MPSPDVAVLGVGMTRFTQQSFRSYESLAQEAVRLAMQDAAIDPLEVEASFCGAVRAPAGLGQRTLKFLGLAGRPIVNVENACASSTTALIEAYAWIRAGMCDLALVVGVERLSHIPGPIPIEANGPTSHWILDSGLNLPAWYALQASEHMNTHGLTPEELAAVTVKNRQHGALNPLAHLNSPVSLQDVLESPVIADPLTLFQCCPKVDGAAAAIVASTDFARSRSARAVHVTGVSLTSGHPVFTDAPPSVNPSTRAAMQAYEQASIGPGDLDVLECHDAFSIGEILYTEALGLCPPGGGAGLVADGTTSLGGDGPTVNPSGGMQSKGHPLGASGIGQLAEIVVQLRGEAGPRQVEGARTGLLHTMGATEFDLDANACTVIIMQA